MLAEMLLDRAWMLLGSIINESFRNSKSQSLWHLFILASVYYAPTNCIRPRNSMLRHIDTDLSYMLTQRQYIVPIPRERVSEVAWLRLPNGPLNGLDLILQLTASWWNRQQWAWRHPPVPVGGTQTWSTHFGFTTSVRRQTMLSKGSVSVILVLMASLAPRKLCEVMWVLKKFC